MQTFADFTAGNAAISAFNNEALPEELRARWIELTSSPSSVDRFVRGGEYIYAHKSDDDMPADALQLAAGLIAFAASVPFHGLEVDNRGIRISRAMRRDSGEKAPEGVEWPDESNDPAPLTEFTAPPPAPATPAPVSA